jgi:hypothetical protein
VLRNRHSHAPCGGTRSTGSHPSDPSAVELEFVPSADKPKEIYVTLARVRIAVRGSEGWIALTPDYTVTDLDDFRGIYIQATGGHA